MRRAIPVMLIVFFSPHFALGAAPAGGDLGSLSLEQLGDIEVTSVSRHAESLLDAPASIFVITREDIRRSGATTLPDALRLAPNLEVARVSSRSYAISARGFNNSIGNKMLVLIDGRTAYTPTFSGVFWDQQDVLLEDVDRIEVVSGPGSTLWGANAFSGVINVITRSAAETQGVLATLGTGTKESEAAVRYGLKLAGGSFRGYAKTAGFGTTTLENGTQVADGWNRQQVGFRGDWGTSADGVTVQGDFYQGAADRIPQGIPTFGGANLLARWTRRVDESSGLRVQAYFDRTHRDDRVAFNDTTDTYDIELQYDQRLSQRQRLVWGGGHRVANDHTIATPLVAFIPADKQLRWTNVFLQDELSLSERLRLTLGGKLESNVYTGWEFLPSARLAWQKDPRSLVWTAVSRTVRAPARIDREFFLPGRPPFLILGGPNFVSETADVIEVGYRAQPTGALSYSVTGFHNVYDKLRSGQVAPAMVQNMMEGRAYGIEAWGSWQVMRGWRLSGGFNTLRQLIHVEPGSTDPTGPSALGNDPGDQWTLRSSHDLGERQEIDILLRHVASLPNPVVPGYTALDARWGWRVDHRLEVSLTLQNAFDPGHVEVGPVPTGSLIARTVFLKAVWRQ